MPARFRVVRSDLRTLGTTYSFSAAALGAYGLLGDSPGRIGAACVLLAAWMAAPRVILGLLRRMGRIAYSDEAGVSGLLSVEDDKEPLRGNLPTVEGGVREASEAAPFPDFAGDLGVFFLLYLGLGTGAAVMLAGAGLGQAGATLAAGCAAAMGRMLFGRR